ncbi:hypothetical protein AURDEDRAFT_127553 [Auricularia subglabra TFB-10046 SS5]|nr:hypothetical protein AURDEDRAFT_127553 [Auricularia subglabra TFB-10046 SS5]
MSQGRFGRFSEEHVLDVFDDALTVVYEARAKLAEAWNAAKAKQLPPQILASHSQRTHPRCRNNRAALPHPPVLLIRRYTDEGDALARQTRALRLSRRCLAIHDGTSAVRRAGSLAHGFARRRLATRTLLSLSVPIDQFFEFLAAQLALPGARADGSGVHAQQRYRLVVAHSMPIAAFTFGSFGDVATILQLLWQLRAALDEASGASAEIRALREDVDAFRLALQQVQAALDRRQPPPHQDVLNGIAHALSVAHNVLDSVLQKIRAFQSRMTSAVGIGAARKYWAVAAWSILGGQKDVDALRMRLSEQLSVIQTDNQAALHDVVERQATTIDRIQSVMRDIQTRFDVGGPPFHFFRSRRYYPACARTSFQRLCDLHMACNGTELQVHIAGQTESFYKPIVFQPADAPGSPFGPHVVVDCFFYKEAAFGEWQVTLGVPEPQARAAAVAQMLKVIVERKHTLGNSCTCDGAHCHARFQREIQERLYWKDCAECYSEAVTLLLAHVDHETEEHQEEYMNKLTQVLALFQAHPDPCVHVRRFLQLTVNSEHIRTSVLPALRACRPDDFNHMKNLVESAPRSKSMVNKLPFDICTARAKRPRCHIQREEKYDRADQRRMMCEPAAGHAAQVKCAGVMLCQRAKLYASKPKRCTRKDGAPNAHRPHPGQDPSLRRTLKTWQRAFTGSAPWPDRTTTAIVGCVYGRVVHPRPRNTAPAIGLSDTWWDICLKCWAYDPPARPHMYDVLKALKDSLSIKSRIIHAQPAQVLSASFVIPERIAIWSSQNTILTIDEVTGKPVETLETPHSTPAHDTSLFAISFCGRQSASGTASGVINRFIYPSCAPLGRFSPVSPIWPLLKQRLHMGDGYFPCLLIDSSLARTHRGAH